MKRILSSALAALTIVSAFTACAPAPEQIDPAITLASSDAQTQAEWLDSRLDVIPDSVIMGVGSSETYQIDMENFEDDGYIARAVDGDVLLFGKTEAGLDTAVREYVHAVEAKASAELDTVFHEGKRIGELKIAGTDISEFTVVYNDDGRGSNPDLAIPEIGLTYENARAAAAELNRLLDIAVGVTLPVVPHTENVTGKVISIGYLENPEILGDDQSFTYEVKDGNLIINGMGDSNGCVNGVQYFFQEECGWRELMYGDSNLQEAELIDVPEGLSKAVDPMFDYIDITADHLFYDQDFTNERNVMYQGIHTAPCHGMHTLLDGVAADELVCHSDEEVYQQVLEGITRKCESYVASGKSIKYDYMWQDISKGDTSDECDCQDCLRVYRQEGNSKNGVVVRFANRLYSDLEAAGYGDLQIAIFAYAGTEKTCKTVPHPNIIIGYAPVNECTNHPYDGSECFGDTSAEIGKSTYPHDINNNHFSSWLKGWGEMTENIWMWHYIIATNYNEYTYFDVLYDNFHLFADYGVKGMLMCASYGGVGIGRLRYKLIYWMQWHPDATEEEYEIAREQIMRDEYGDGYEQIMEYIRIWHSTEAPAGCWNAWDFFMPSQMYSIRFDEEVFYNHAEEMYDLVDSALLETHNLHQVKYVELLKLDILYKWSTYGYKQAKAAEDAEKMAYYEGIYAEFWEIADKYNLGWRFRQGEFLDILYTIPDKLGEVETYDTNEIDFSGVY